MKIRSDFVSNSSSSSFIIANNDVFDNFNITKKDIINALTDLMGKDYVDTYIKNQKKTRKDPERSKYLSKAEKKYPNEVGPFYVYDLTNKNDKRKAIELWGDLLKDWDNKYLSYNKDKKQFIQDCKFRDYSNYSNICRQIAQVYNLNIFNGIIKTKKDITILSRFIKTECKQPDNRYGYDTKKGCKDIGKFLYNLRKDMGIVTNKDTLYLKFSKFFIHFDDNQVHYIKDIGYACKHDKLYDNPMDSYEIRHNKEIKNNKYNSPSYSTERVIEILFNYFSSIDKSKNDNNSKKNSNSKFKSKCNKDKVTESTYKDIYDYVVAGCMHEG